MKFSVYIFIFLLLLVSCKPKQNMVYMSNDNFKEEVSQARYQGLHIQEGDILEIIVSAFDDIAVKPFNKASMTQVSETTQGGSTVPSEYVVNTDGTIDFPVLGNIFVKGMTKEQMKQDMEKRLRRYLTDPMVSIKLKNFNISILGEVRGPGQKTSGTEKLNVFQALALAGDMTEDANRTNVKLIRYSEETGKDNVISLDLSEAGIVNSPYYYLQQNDILYVEPDRNKLITANSNASVDKIIKYGGVALGILTLVLSLTRR